MTRNIVIAPCGNKSELFRKSWLDNKKIKDFDLCLLFYHKQIDLPELYQDIDYFYHLQDFKYHMIYNLLKNVKPDLLLQYDYFYFLDDDIEISTSQINQMFANAKAMSAKVCQASLTRDSFCSWPMFKQNVNCFCRYVGQIEVMAPLFEREALKACLDSFIGNRSSWGVDSVWSKLLEGYHNGLIVFDNVAMRHTQPVGSGELYLKLGTPPHKEWEDITQKYNARKHYYKEIGRLLYIDAKHTPLMHLSIAKSNLIDTLRRKINDYGFYARVTSTLSRMTRNLK